MSETVVRNFSPSSQTQLSNIKASLGLTLSDEMLTFCARHYQTVERRAPFSDELALLSALATELERLPDADCIYDFSTADEEIATTYADAIEKRKLINPRASYPPTLSELASLPTQELCRIGLRPPHQDIRAQLAPDMLLEDGTAALTTSSGGVHLRPDRLPAQGDVLLLLTPCERHLGAHLSPVPIKRTLRLDRVGILCTLLSHFEGFAIDLGTFAADHTPASLTVLTGEGYRGAYVICVAKSDLRALLHFTKEEGIPCFAFAQLTDTQTVTFRHPQRGLFSLQAPFLRSLYRRKRHTVRIDEEHLVPCLPIEHTPITSDTCAYLERSPAQKKEEQLAFVGITACSAASISLSDAPFRIALYTALVPILTQVSHGIPLQSQSLSLSLTYSNVSTCLSALLGIYRLQTELAIPAHEHMLIPADKETPASLTVFSLADAFPHSAKKSSRGATVYCHRIELGENGLPCFASLRQTLALLADLSEKRLIRSVRVLVNETVADGLSKMCAGAAYRPTEALANFDAPLSLGVLIESDAEITLDAVAVTAAPSDVEKAAEVAIPSFLESLIPSDLPEIVILAERGDEDARFLSYELRTKGARVHRFSPSDEALVPLTRAVLGAHALILCRNVKIFENARLSFAVDTMRRAGGSVLALYESDDESLISLPNGIPESVLSSFLKKS